MKKNLLLALLGLLLVACGGDGGDDILDNTGGNGGGGGSEPTLTLTRAQVVGNWKDTYGRNSLTEDWVAVTNPFIHCFDEDGTYRTLYQGKKMSEGTWTITGNKIVVTATLYTDTYEVLSLEGDEMEFAYYSNGTLTNYNRAVRTEEDEKPENKTFTVRGVTFKIVAVEGGTFQMGAPDDDTDAYDADRPQHAVTLSDFYIGKFNPLSLCHLLAGRHPLRKRKEQGSGSCARLHHHRRQRDLGPQRRGLPPADRGRVGIRCPWRQEVKGLPVQRLE